MTTPTPCPWCDKTDMLIKSFDFIVGYRYTCARCNIEGPPTGRDAGKALEAWDTRPLVDERMKI